MGAYDQFDTSDINFSEGQWIPFGDFDIKVKFAGRENKNFGKELEQSTRKYRRLLDESELEDLSDSVKKQLELIYIQVYAKTIIEDWRNLTDRDGNVLECTYENRVKVMTDLPRLFEKVQEQAGKLSTFRRKQLENDEKNS